MQVAARVCVARVRARQNLMPCGVESPHPDVQVDTRNRECGVTRADITNCTSFTPSLEPRQARSGPDGAMEPIDLAVTRSG